MTGTSFPDGFPMTPLEAINYSYFLSDQDKVEWRDWLKNATDEQQGELVEILHSMWQDNQKAAIPQGFSTGKSNSQTASNSQSIQKQSQSSQNPNYEQNQNRNYNELNRNSQQQTQPIPQPNQNGNFNQFNQNPLPPQPVQPTPAFQPVAPTQPTSQQVPQPNQPTPPIPQPNQNGNFNQFNQNPLPPQPITQPVQPTPAFQPVAPTQPTSQQVPQPNQPTPPIPQPNQNQNGNKNKNPNPNQNNTSKDNQSKKQESKNDAKEENSKLESKSFDEKANLSNQSIVDIQREYLRLHQQEQNKFHDFIKKTAHLLDSLDSMNLNSGNVIDGMLDANNKISLHARKIQALENATQNRGSSLQDQIDDIKYDLDKLIKDFKDLRNDTRKRYDEISQQLAGMQAGIRAIETEF